jgi:hypothetical protein
MRRPEGKPLTDFPDFSIARFSQALAEVPSASAVDGAMPIRVPAGQGLAPPIPA